MVFLTLAGYPLSMVSVISSQTEPAQCLEDKKTHKSERGQGLHALPPDQCPSVSARSFIGTQKSQHTEQCCLRTREMLSPMSVRFGTAAGIVMEIGAIFFTRSSY